MLTILFLKHSSQLMWCIWCVLRVGNCAVVVSDSNTECHRLKPWLALPLPPDI